MARGPRAGPQKSGGQALGPEGWGGGHGGGVHFQGSHGCCLLRCTRSICETPSGCTLVTGAVSCTRVSYPGASLHPLTKWPGWPVCAGSPLPARHAWPVASPGRWDAALWRPGNRPGQGAQPGPRSQHVAGLGLGSSTQPGGRGSGSDSDVCPRRQTVLRLELHTGRGWGGAAGGRP